MNTDIMVKILSMLDAKMKSQNWNVILTLKGLGGGGHFDPPQVFSW